MTAGKLASVKPGATTNTLLYRCPINKASSCVLNAVNQSGSTASYRVGLRDYDQTLTLDDTNYLFRRGNVVTSYQLEITPGVQISSLSPGDLVELSNQNASFKYFDFFVPTDTITIPVKVDSVGTASYTNLTGGSFAVGDTITGANGLTANIYYDNSTSSFSLSIDDITNADTTFLVSGDGTNISANDLLNIDSELVTVSSLTGNQVTVTRATSATTAASHTAGSVVKIVRPTANTTTISADITDTAATSITVADATGASLTVGDYIRINNEFLLIGQIATNTLTVARGQLGTTAATHTSGDTVTRHTDQGYVALQYFQNGEIIDNGSGVTAEINISNSLPTRTFIPAKRFVYDLNNDSTYSLPISTSLNIGRIYRFTQEDASNTGELLSFTNTLGSAYSTTVTINGTPGSVGAYTEIEVTEDVPSIFNIIGVTSGIGVSGTVNSNPLYTTIYVYDVEGTIIATDSFETSTGTNTITTVTPGPYGYVQSASGSTLNVSLGLNSSAFSGSEVFYDSPRTFGDVRSSATVSTAASLTDIDVEDYLFYDSSISSNSTTQLSSIVVGPGQSVVVYSSAATINYILNGFEDSTNDYTVNLYERTAQSGGGGITPTI